MLYITGENDVAPDYEDKKKSRTGEHGYGLSIFRDTAKKIRRTACDRRQARHLYSRYDDACGRGQPEKLISARKTDKKEGHNRGKCLDYDLQIFSSVLH